MRKCLYRSACSLAVLIALGLSSTRGWAQTYQYLFQDPRLPIEQRINNILSLMSPE